MAEDSLSIVTGAGGFVGAHLCRLLASRDERFLGILSPRTPEPAPGVEPWPGGSFRSMDLQDTAAIRELLADAAPTRIFNLAAVGTHPHRKWDAMAYIDVNVRLPAALFEQAPPGCVLVQVGSMAQYKGSAEPLHEDEASRDFTTLYSWSKNAADSLLQTMERSATDRRPSVIRARLFGVVGGGEPEHRLLPSLVRGCRDSAEVALSDGSQIRDLLHVEDAVSAMAHVSEDSSLLGAAVNIARGEGRSVRWIAEHAAERLSCRDKLRFGAIPRRAYESHQQLVADVSRLHSTGWRPRWNLEESVARALDQIVGGPSAAYAISRGP
ncbi:MAG TPA: NAD-dependent epimerase/dehydratase [Candidatus Limnocylindria bacterium]|jgi:nucleoside-diphosphate-sugar epimerase|nr:NAD-dependent epimerase/dehydratase [Candidatus Limnocylindria bacterium]